MKIISTAVLVMLTGVLITLGYVQQRNADSFFSNALKNAEISETVTVKNTSYSVAEGVVSPTDMHTVDVLKIAYALALAQRSPLMALPGTDPAVLAREAVALGNVEGRLEQVQKNASDKTLIRNLYPVQFLGSIADLEEARQAFLASGSDKDESRYESALGEALSAETSDLNAFTTAFNAAGGSRSVSFTSLGGTLSREQMRASLADIEQGLLATKKQMTQREECFAGYTRVCNTSLLDLPVITNSSSSVQKSTVLPASVLESRSLFSEAGGSPGPTVALASSVCTGALPGPYYFSLTSESDSFVRFASLNELFFTPTTVKNAKVLRYLHDTLDMSFSLANPTNFYVCPDGGSDLARVQTVLTIRDYAQAHPLIARTARTQLLALPMVADEGRAVAYVNEALAEQQASPDQELTEFALMLQDRSAGLDVVVGNIASSDANDLRLAEKGVPFDLSASTLFLTHSAFPSLFQSYNPSFGAAGVQLHTYSAADMKTFFTDAIPESVILTSVARTKLVHDLHAYFEFEHS